MPDSQSALSARLYLANRETCTALQATQHLYPVCAYQQTASNLHVCVFIFTAIKAILGTLLLVKASVFTAFDYVVVSCSLHMVALVRVICGILDRPTDSQGQYIIFLYPVIDVSMFTFSEPPSMPYIALSAIAALALLSVPVVQHWKKSRKAGAIALV